MAKELACRKCKHVTIGKVCNVCKSTDLSPDWSGIALIVDPATSHIAKTLGITLANGWKKENPKYALKVT